jgi:hypothetical protein
LKSRLKWSIEKPKVSTASSRPSLRNSDHNETDALQYRARQVDIAAHVNNEGEQGNRQQHQRVDIYLLFGEVDNVGQRQHRLIGFGVVVAAVDRLWPEVGRGPDKDD